MTIQLKSEQILLALLPVLQGGEPTLTRNTPLPDLSGTVKVVRLLDGPKPEQTEAFLNPPMYEFTMRPFVQVVVSNMDDAARDAAVNDAVENLLTAIGTIADDLTGLVTDIRPQPVSGTPRELFGIAGMKAAELEIEIDYWSDSSAG